MPIFVYNPTTQQMEQRKTQLEEIQDKVTSGEPLTQGESMLLLILNPPPNKAIEDTTIDDVNNVYYTQGQFLNKERQDAAAAGDQGTKPVVDERTKLQDKGEVKTKTPAELQGLQFGVGGGGFTPEPKTPAELAGLQFGVGGPGVITGDKTFVGTTAVSPEAGNAGLVFGAGGPGFITGTTTDTTTVGPKDTGGWPRYDINKGMLVNEDDTAYIPREDNLGTSGITTTVTTSTVTSGTTTDTTTTTSKTTTGITTSKTTTDVTTSGITGGTTTGVTTSPVTTNAEVDYLRKMLDQMQKQYADLIAGIQKPDAAGAQAAADAKAAADALAKEKRESAISILSARFREYGLETLVPDIVRLATEGASQDTITLELQKTDAYKQRFRANEERKKKGLTVLQPGDYLGLEDNYRQLLRSYGLRQFDTDDYVSQFIANDVSQAELSSRIVTAVQRVQNADPGVSATLRQFYNITDNDLVAYVLDPNQQLPKIERQVAAAEIGSAARRQGIQAGVNVAEQLAAQGITKAEAQRGYATIADILPEATKLSSIYGKTMEGYGLEEAEQEVFNQLASAQRKRRQLAEREVAAFSGQTGMTRQSLTSETKGQF